MQVVLQFGHALVRGICAALLLGAAVSPAQANWATTLSKAAREAGEAGTKAAKHGAAALDTAAAHIKSLPAAGRVSALAVHATPEGHWKFVNRDGEVFTAGTPDELKRAVPSLLPEAPADSRLALYLTEDTVFGERALVKDLPKGANLHVVVRRDSYPLMDRTVAGKETLFASVRPNLLVELKTKDLFGEAIALLERPLSRSSIRTLALEPGGPRGLASVPRFEPATKGALVDAIDPGKLADALYSVRGQTVLITGRVQGNLIHFRPQSGPEQTVKILDLTRAAANADVNLVLLHAPAPRQPGGRNWLWQRIAVDGLDDALKRATFGDFLDALGARHGAFRVGVVRDGDGRVLMRASPTGSAVVPTTDLLGGWWATAVAHITGGLVTGAVDIYARDEARTRELDQRIVPGVPAIYQFIYIAGLVAGVMGWHVAHGWWKHLWPAEQRSEYATAVGYRAAQVSRFLVFLFVFLPIVGGPALLVATVTHIFRVLMLPFRLLYWLFGRMQARAG